MEQEFSNLFVKGEQFFIKFGQSFLHGDILYKESRYEVPDVLFLHGGHKADSRNDFFLVRQVLLKQYGLTTCAFDCIGHGSTGGELYDSSLENRTKQMSDIVDACFDSQPFSIVAVGMGAYNALKLSELFSIENFIFILPKFYSSDVYDSAFESGVVHSISLLSEQNDTDAWSMLDRFQGNVSMISSQEEQSIPTVLAKNQVSSLDRLGELKIQAITSDSSRMMECVNNGHKELAALAENIANTVVL